MKNIITSSILFASATLAFGAFDTSTGIVDSNTTFTGTETITTLPLTINKDAVLTIGDGVNASSLAVEYSESPLMNNGKIIVQKGSTFTAKHTTAKSYGNGTDSGAIDVYGTANLTSYSSTAYTYITGDINVYGGTLYSNSIFRTKDNVNVTLYEGSTLSSKDFYMYNNSVVKIYDNVTINSNLLTISSYQSATIDASNASVVQLKKLAFTRSNNLTIKLSSQLFSVNAFDPGSASYLMGGKFILEDFQNNVFQLKDYSNIIINGETFSIEGDGGSMSLIAKDSTGNVITLEEDQYWYFTDDGFLNIANFGNVAVPEPAQWAVIFGALALGLAIYRKRK